MIAKSTAKRNKIGSFLGFRKPPAQPSPPSPPPLSPTTANAEFKRVRDAEMEQDLVVSALEERLIGHQHQVRSGIDSDESANKRTYRNRRCGWLSIQRRPCGIGCARSRCRCCPREVRGGAMIQTGADVWRR